ncbi:hypothetical protein [Paraburkholderia sp. HD33-4]|uniref:hypothetical protein n=1 Tax=Paraburkholderia sp. HD33-4 TaxID=2883242 RepID=UPI001F47CD29|nr:hypothetical protein [Paraburkholderia sp. HD33-4]
MEKRSTAAAGAAKTAHLHRIVQRAIRSAAIASTPDSAIDLLGEALLELERLVAQTNAPMH